MATKVPPKKNTAFTFHVALVSQANTKIFQANPTLATGDAKVSIDGGSFANLGTTPSAEPASGKSVLVTLTSDEMNGDEITVLLSDASGAEWCDRYVTILTTARQIDDLAYPTVSGRSLDVSTGGEAGVDWANVGSPTTTVGLSGTTVKTATDVETDTADIQTRIPAALVSGRIDSSVGAMAANVLTATAINADAITDAKVASDVTIASVTGAVGSVAGNVDGNVTGSVGSLATQAKADVNAEADTAISDAALATAADLTTVDTVVDAIKVVTDALTSAAAANLALSAGTIVVATAITGTLSTTQMTTDLTEATDDHYNGRIVIFTSGVLTGQATDITDYTGSSKLVTMTALTESPSNNDTFIIV